MELTVDQALQRGIAAHKEGKLQDAERLYRAILQSQPTHPDANHNLGVLAVSVNKAEAALPLFKAALEANPKIEQFWLSYIDALIKIERFDAIRQVLTDAQQAGVAAAKLQIFEEQLQSEFSLGSHTPQRELGSSLECHQDLLLPAIELREVGEYKEAQEWLNDFIEQNSDNAEALSLLSQVLLLDKKEAEAEHTLIAAVSIDPELPSVYRNQARLLLKQSKAAEALEKAELGCKESPDDLESLMVLASCLRANQRDAEALLIVEKVLEAEPNHAEAYANRALIKMREEDMLGALKDSEMTVSLKPHLTQVWFLLGSLHYQSGNLSDAIEALRRAHENEPENPVFMTQLGEFLRQDNKADEAINILAKATKLAPKDSNAWTNFGVALQQEEKLADAKTAYEKALALNPNSAAIVSNLGAMAKDAKDWESALRYFEKALEIEPNLAEAHSNLGITLQELGRLDEAEASCRKAIALKPDLAEAHSNLSIPLKEQGKLDEAEASCRKAIALKPDHAEAHSNLGITLKELGKSDEAEASYRKAIALKPDFAEAHSNLGATLTELGRSDESVSACVRAIHLKADFDSAYSNLGEALKGARFNKADQSLYPTLINLLTKGNFVRPKDVAGAILSLLWLDNLVEDALLNKTAFIDIKEIDLAIKALTHVPLLHHLMRICPLPDLQLEALFVSMRRVLLAGIGQIEASPELTHFLSSLSLHCFTNEYVYYEIAEEAELISNLETAIAENIRQGSQPTITEILILATYRPLHQYEWSETLQALDRLAEVKVRLVEEPLAERVIAQNMPVLSSVNDEVSRKVRQQYEESPYPRWVQLAIPSKVKSIAEVCNEAKLQLRSENIKSVVSPSILIAGCGTGQHSIGTATRFANCQVTAIDLSRSSLAYAQRKTSDLGITNIEYLQADILNLGELGQEFDVIESAGVLHHMDDPMAGWRVLVDLLKNGGLMKIGLYSELARRHVVKTRSEIETQRIGASEAEIRQFRQSIVESDDEQHQLLRGSSAFFSLSSLRDLIFHVQEHRFTLPQIQHCLDELGLQFCGFENKDLARQFKDSLGKESDAGDLSLWHQFERENPSAFAGMYQFWCQKL